LTRLARSMPLTVEHDGPGTRMISGYTNSDNALLISQK
jgi:hypothetical protein